MKNCIIFRTLKKILFSELKTDKFLISLPFLCDNKQSLKSQLSSKINGKVFFFNFCLWHLRIVLYRKPRIESNLCLILGD